MARGRRQAPEVRVAETLGNLPEPEKPKPENPARAAARLLLAQALETAGATAEEAGRDGIVSLVRVPSIDWTEPARDAWAAWLRRGERWSDGENDRSRYYGDWVAWTPKQQPKMYELNQSIETFADAVAEGRHAAGFAADLEWLPADLVQAADNRLEMPTLTGADVAALAFSLCGERAAVTLSDEQAAQLTPRLLRLAQRPRQGADDYICKLRDLLARDQMKRATTSATTTSPREVPTLERLHGIDGAVTWGVALARDFGAWRAGWLPWAQVDRGCLLSGPPGSGKTLFARALAATCNIPLVAGSWGQWHASGTGHQGDFLRAMRGAFATAKEKAAADGGAILFIDEVDSFPNRETIKHNWRDYEIQVVNALLAELDGVEARDGVVVLAACNHPHLLDPALTRSGRLDRHIRISLPDQAALARILREHLGEDLAGVSLKEAALSAAGATGADCERYVRGARRRAREAGRILIPADLLAEIGGADDRSEAELRIAAIHEAGHAVAACALWPGSLRALTLRPAAAAGGAVIADIRARYLRMADVRDLLIVLLAGRAAETEILGEPSAGAGGGAGSDLAHATGLAAEAVSSLGLDEERGLVWMGITDPATLPTALRDDPALADRVKRMLAEAHEQARALVRALSEAVTALSQALLERRALDGAEAAEIIGGHIAAPSPCPAFPTESVDRPNCSDCYNGGVR